MATFQELTDSFESELAEVFDDVIGAGLTGNAFLTNLGRELISDIQLRSRRGYGVRKDGGSLYRFPRLSQDYIDERKTAQSNGILAQTTGPRRSNITYTGQMLDSLRSYKGDNAGILRIEFNNTLAGSKASDLHQNRRPFLFLSRSNLNYVTAEIDRELEKRIVAGLRRSGFSFSARFRPIG